MGQLVPGRKSLWRARFGRGVTAVVGVGPAAVLVRQAVVTVAAAATISGATLLSAQAVDDWHRAVREEIKWSALVQNDVHYVYLDEGLTAWQVEIADVLAERSEELTRTPGLTGQLARIDADAHATAASQIRLTHKGNDTLLGTDRYRLPSGGQDLQRRLADIRAATGVAAPDPLLGGDERFRVATVLSATSVPLVALHLLLLAVTRRRRKAFLPHDGSGELVARPRGRGALVRRAAGMVPLVAWAAVTTLPAAQLYEAKLEARAQQSAAIQAVHITTATACSSMLSTFFLQSTQSLDVRQMTSLGAQFAALDVPDAELSAAVARLGAAQEPAWQALAGIARTMSRPPTAEDGVDSATVRVTTAQPEDLARFIEQQHRSADLANLAGDRAGLLSLAIFLAALVGALRRPGPRTPLHVVHLLLMGASAAVATWAFTT